MKLNLLPHGKWRVHTGDNVVEVVMVKAMTKSFLDDNQIRRRAGRTR